MRIEVGGGAYVFDALFDVHDASTTPPKRATGIKIK
jgi:hypothetical protein